MFKFNENKEWAENISVVTQLGLTMAGSIIFCLFIGQYIGKHIGLLKIFTFVSIILGVFGGGNVCYRQLLSLESTYHKKDVLSKHKE